jgi:hypothetical protein
MKNICYTSTLISILIFGLLSSVLGQDIDRSPPKWELGVDLYSLFKPAEEQLFRSTYGLMLKKQVNKDHALRFRTNFGISFVPNPIVKGTNQPRNYNLSFDFGREKQRRFGKFIHYYGADLQFKYINTNSTTGFGVNGAPATFTQSKGYVMGGGVSAFMGGKYLLTERIGLSIETNAMLSYVKIHGTYQDIDINGQPLNPKMDSHKSNGLDFNITPISAIYLSYFF